jgi:hypothetical protein
VRPTVTPLPPRSDRDRDARATMRLMVATTGAAVWPSLPLGRRERVLRAVNDQ